MHKFFPRIGGYGLVLALLGLWIATTDIQAAEASNRQLINTAGKQRMLSQRLLSKYALIGMQVKYGDPVQDLEKAVALFDQNLQELKQSPLAAAAAKELQEVEKLWTPIRAVVKAGPEREKMARLRDDMEALLKACEQATAAIAKASGSANSEIITLAGRQRMLSQRLASLYLLRVWGVEDPRFTQDLAQTMAEFSSAQQKLMDSPLTTAEIRLQLEAVKKDFSWFELMAKSESGRYIPTLIARSADQILEKMDAITAQYESLQAQ